MIDTESREVSTSPDTQAQPQPRRSRRRGSLRNLGEIGALVALVVVFSALNPGSFPTLANFQTILDQAALPLIVGVGATMVILMGSIDLSVEGIMGAAGMTFVLLSANSRETVDLGLTAILVAVAVGAVLGLATGLVHTRLAVPSFIVTLGMWYVGLGLATLLFGRQQIPFLSDTEMVAWPSSLTLGLPNSFLVAALVVAVGVGVTSYTKLGRFTYAIGNNEAIARSNGIPVARYKVLVFTLAGACSGLAAVLASLQLGAGSATIGIGMLFLTIAAVVIGGTSLGGGRGGILRTVLGVLLLITLNNGLVLSGVSPNVQSGISGIVLIAAITFAAWPHRDRLRVVK